MEKIDVHAMLLSENDRLAAQNRARLAAAQVMGINLMAAPGAGKTYLIERTIEALRGRLRIGVIEGDIASSVDAERIAQLGVPTHQINTGGDCHLEARHVVEGLDRIPLGEIDIMFIENVGNLVCPTSFDLGQEVKLMISSVAEGHDKPLKYPAMFQSVDVVIVNKIDLLGICPFNRGSFLGAVRQLNPNAPIFELSCMTGEGIARWAEWVKDRLEDYRASLQR